MVEAVMLWNEPNNLSHWDFKIDPEWKRFAEMAIAGARAVRRVNPEMRIVLGGISPIDPNFVRLMESHGVLDAVDIVAVHGFPLDWNHWQVQEWPEKIAEIRAVTKKPVWVSEVGRFVVRGGRGAALRAGAFGGVAVTAGGAGALVQPLRPAGNLDGNDPP